ncbi:DNA-binding transcriptional MocR family regulator [Leucobacter luti]|uniref:aminotransferase-like domain-containing protein n=1 Tax=Leucobacter luti TaxID=340320 RepID=UPI00105157B7|nr:PLP-dependent aminotransferase family protein [Leucobacter luti]MCW2287816.1 DNA-binding transcriptional MocR family regulator [Leucobacter luti]TCK46021.1 DNA-binding transcriptional MocR family regulator [Leucobacter luti]
MIQNNRSAEIAAALSARLLEMSAGTKLPGVRELAAEFRASPATISAALAELTALGKVRAEPGRGTFALGRQRVPEPDFAWQSQALGPLRVDPDRASRLGNYGSPHLIPLSWGYLAPELQPGSELHRIGARAAKSPRTWAMTPPAGSVELRRVLAAEYRADPSEVLVVAGGQQGLVYAMRTLAEPGSTVITESPSYPGAILAAQSAGLRIAAVPSDDHGILVDQLAAELERTRARVIYLQPSYANPTGVVLSAERRRAVVALAVAHGAFIIEDDWARQLSIDEPAPAPLFASAPDGHVVSVMTLSKPISPGLRLGAIIARGPAGERLRAARVADDLCVAPVLQETALELLTSGAWQRHLKRVRSELAVRRDVLVEAVTSSLPAARIPMIPRGGLHLWLRLPHGTDTREVVTAAHAAGVLVGDGRHFYADEPPAPYVRLSFGAAAEPELREGVRRLASLQQR